MKYKNKIKKLEARKNAYERLMATLDPDVQKGYTKPGSVNK